MSKKVKIIKSRSLVFEIKEMRKSNSKIKIVKEHSYNNLERAPSGQIPLKKSVSSNFENSRQNDSIKRSDSLKIRKEVSKFTLKDNTENNAMTCGGQFDVIDENKAIS